LKIAVCQGGEAHQKSNITIIYHWTVYSTLTLVRGYLLVLVDQNGFIFNISESTGSSGGSYGTDYGGVIDGEREATGREARGAVEITGNIIHLIFTERKSAG
jgi:hypothetical protein